VQLHPIAHLDLNLANREVLEIVRRREIGRYVGVIAVCEVAGAKASKAAADASRAASERRTIMPGFS
jgi:hypothetical protein